MASVQPTPEMGQAPMPANITREQIQRVYQVCIAPVTCFAPGAIAHPHELY